MTPKKPEGNSFAMYAWNKEADKIKKLLNAEDPLKEFLATTTDQHRVKMVLAAINQKDLYATHNMSLQGLKQALKLGGLAMPSLLYVF